MHTALVDKTTTMIGGPSSSNPGVPEGVEAVVVPAGLVSTSKLGIVFTRSRGALGETPSALERSPS